MKIGDVIEIEGQGKQEIYIREFINEVYILGLKVVPEKSGLDMAWEEYFSDKGSRKGYCKDCSKEAFDEGADALLKYGEWKLETEKCIRFEDLKKWCGK